MIVLFDECIPRICAHEVAAHLKYIEGIEGFYLLDLPGARQGMPDNYWPVKYCQPAGDWLVITQDAGRKSGRVFAKGLPLPAVLPMSGITSFFLRGNQFCHAKSNDKTARIIMAIPQILERFRSADPGERFSVRIVDRQPQVVPWPPLSSTCPPPGPPAFRVSNPGVASGLVGRGVRPQPMIARRLAAWRCSTV